MVVDISPDESGRRRQRWHSGYDTRREAQKALTEILGRLQAGTYIEPSKATLAQYLEGWLGSARVSVRPATYATYATLCRVHIIPRIGATPLQRLGRDQLNSMYADLLDSGRRDGKGGLASRSVRHVHTTIHTALAAAVEEGTLARNVADLAKPPARGGSKEPATWTAEELRTFLEHVREDRVYALYHLAGTTGLRRGETLRAALAGPRPRRRPALGQSDRRVGRLRRPVLRAEDAGGPAQRGARPGDSARPARAPEAAA